MTIRGEKKLVDIETEELRDRLADRPEEGQAVVRLVAAREYKDGLSPPDIEDKYGWPAGTVHNWLDYFDERGIDDALVDKHRSGRPPKLTDGEHEQFVGDLHESPEAFGYDRQAWSPRLAHHHLKDTFDVEYTLRHVRRLMNEAGLSWRTARQRHYEADPESEAESHDPS